MGKILHKGVRSADGELLGNVIALHPDSIHIESEGSKIKYELPKDVKQQLNLYRITVV